VLTESYPYAISWIMSRNPDHLSLKWLHRAGNRLYLKENQDWYKSMGKPQKPQRPQNITDIVLFL
jgi:hypothetical protein